MAQNISDKKYSSAKQIINLIIKNTGSQIIPNTVDVIKEGSPDNQIHGIATCMFATMDVLKQAVEKNCNLIIVHEPLYYNHLDETTNIQNDKIYLEKKQFINSHNLVIWRFHDYIHSIKPDAILTGMINKLGWKDYLVDKNSSDQFVLPVTTLKELLKSLKEKFPKSTFNVIGNPEMKLSHVYLAPGAPGGSAHLSILADPKIDVLIAGEAPQWETYEYVRDAVDQGKPKAVIFLGHIASKQAGMDYGAEWIRKFITDIPVYFIETKLSNWTY
jgi:putative NIF3 family GTP cyclohydrolase 1 type 2